MLVSNRPIGKLQRCEVVAPINSHFNVVVRSPTPFGSGRNSCWLSRGSQLPRALPFIFSLCCPLNDGRRGSTQLLQNRSPVFSFLLSFSCPSLSHHSSPSLDERKHSFQPWPHLFLLCVRWKCDLVGQVSEMLHLLQMGPSRVLTTFPFQTQNTWQLSLLELPPLLCPHS